MEIKLLNILDFFNFRKDLKSLLGSDLLSLVKDIFIDQYRFFYVKRSSGEKMLWKVDKINDKFEIIDIFDIKDKNSKKIFGQRYYKKDFVYVSNKGGADSIVSKLGCIESSSNKFMKMNLSNINIHQEDFINFEFEKLEKGKNEEIRCDLQNTAFYSNKRSPLKVKDVRYEMSRKCYISELAYFLKQNDEYLGYGQVLLLDDKYTVSNFCIKPLHQSKGMGAILLKFLLYKANEFGINEIYIKVKSDNLIACRLYESLGFKTFEKTLFYNI